MVNSIIVRHIYINKIRLSYFVYFSHLTALLILAVPPTCVWGQLLERSEVACCADAFTADEIAKQVRLPQPKSGITQLLVIRSQPAEPKTGPGYHGNPLSVLKDRLPNQIDETPAVAYIIQNVRGASLSLWVPATNLYSERRIWGSGPARLDSYSQILHIAPDRISLGNDACDGLKVYVWQEGSPISIDRAKELYLLALKNLQVGCLELFVGSIPLFWESLEFPMLVPAFGKVGIDRILATTEVKCLHCVYLPDIAASRCWWSVQK